MIHPPTNQLALMIVTRELVSAAAIALKDVEDAGAYKVLGHVINETSGCGSNPFAVEHRQEQPKAEAFAAALTISDVRLA
jgi:hypothetical protein